MSQQINICEQIRLNPKESRRQAATATNGAKRARRKFLRFFPQGFGDQTYLDWERGYKGRLDGKIDPSFVITHRLSLADASNGYATFKNHANECIKVVMTTNGSNGLSH
jgi:hypothetical protein